MNSGLKKLGNAFLSLTQTVLIPVRYRYYADKIAKGRILKKFGYKDKVFSGGVLPRLPNAKRLLMPIYRPGNAWTKEKAYFGQNDYIDILGGKRLKPSDVAYDVPAWLRGKRGNEMSLLILKRKVFYNTQYALDHPVSYENISKRIRYLYKYLNRKTKTGLTWKQ